MIKYTRYKGKKNARNATGKKKTEKGEVINNHAFFQDALCSQKLNFSHKIPAYVQVSQFSLQIPLSPTLPPRRAMFYPQNTTNMGRK